MISITQTDTSSGRTGCTCTALTVSEKKTIRGMYLHSFCMALFVRLYVFSVSLCQRTTCCCATLILWWRAWTDSGRFCAQMEFILRRIFSIHCVKSTWRMGEPGLKWASINFWMYIKSIMIKRSTELYVLIAKNAQSKFYAQFCNYYRFAFNM